FPPPAKRPSRCCFCSRGKVAQTAASAAPVPPSGAPPSSPRPHAALLFLSCPRMGATCAAPSGCAQASNCRQAPGCGRAPCGDREDDSGDIFAPRPRHRDLYGLDPADLVAHGGFDEVTPRHDDARGSASPPGGQSPPEAPCWAAYRPRREEEPAQDADGAAGHAAEATAARSAPPPQDTRHHSGAALAACAPGAGGLPPDPEEAGGAGAGQRPRFHCRRWSCRHRRWSPRTAAAVPALRVRPRGSGRSRRQTPPWSTCAA
ncbi:unnamed protein product, partial [Prorocentrum cordatum]